MSMLAIERREGVLRVEKARPEALNVLDELMAAQITQAFSEAATDPGVRCVVLSGRGKVFSAGADIQYMKRQGEASEAANLEDARKFAGMLLHGITGSGKTAIYLAAMRSVLEVGRSAILLVPESGLTPAGAADLHQLFG